jgi:uncharacterized protein
MAKFEIKAFHPITQEEKILHYDSSLSTLKWEDGSDVVSGVQTKPDVKIPAKINYGKHNLKTIKIQLGLSCNFECDYCSQRFVPHADSTNPSDVQPFVDNMSTWFDGGDDGIGGGTRVEFWGGEPFVYWKTFKPLAEAINLKYPNSRFLVINNGSMLDEEKIEWLQKYNFDVAVSHDGPGQPVRGPDPLDDPICKESIAKLFKILAPQGKFSFNAMIHAKNISREAIQNFFENFVRNNCGEEYLQYLFVGEGGIIDVYDEGGMANSLVNEEDEIKYRNIVYNELRDGKAKRFQQVYNKVNRLVESVLEGTRIESLGQKCGMDRSDNIAVDLNGNVITCQNTTAVSNNPAGFSHLIGSIKEDISKIEVKTATHWSDREECPKCPVIHICKGSCMFLSGEFFEQSCNNAFSDSIVNFAVGIEKLSGGYIPMYIDGPHRQDRKDIFWWVNGKPEKVRTAKKIIPIVAV